MKSCQICGTQFDDATCPNCGEATWIEALPETKPKQQPNQNASQNQKRR